MYLSTSGLLPRQGEARTLTLTDPAPCPWTFNGEETKGLASHTQERKTKWNKERGGRHHETISLTAVRTRQGRGPHAVLHCRLSALSQYSLLADCRGCRFPPPLLCNSPAHCCVLSQKSRFVDRLLTNLKRCHCLASLVVFPSSATFTNRASSNRRTVQRAQDAANTDS